MSSFRTYEFEVKLLEDSTPTFSAALDSAMLHTASLGGGVGPREHQIVQVSAVAKEWERWRKQGMAWADTLVDVMMLCDVHHRLMHQQALLHLEQVHVGLIILRCLAAAKQVFNGSGRFQPADASMSMLRQALLVRVKEALALCSNKVVLPPHMLAEQDQALADLSALGCGMLPARLRRLTLSELHAFARIPELQAGELEHAPKLASAQCWDRCCLQLSQLLSVPLVMPSSELPPSGADAEGEAAVVASALLRALRWLQPLALGCPSPPAWLRPISSVHSRPEPAAAAATWIQRRWRSRQVCVLGICSPGCLSAHASTRGAESIGSLL